MNWSISAMNLALCVGSNRCAISCTIMYSRQSVGFFARSVLSRILRKWLCSEQAGEGYSECVDAGRSVVAGMCSNLKVIVGNAGQENC